MICPLLMMIRPFLIIMHGLPPRGAPIMIAEKRKKFCSCLRKGAKGSGSTRTERLLAVLRTGDWATVMTIICNYSHMSYQDTRAMVRNGEQGRGST